MLNNQQWLEGKRECDDGDNNDDHDRSRSQSNVARKVVPSRRRTRPPESNAARGHPEHPSSIHYDVNEGRGTEAGRRGAAATNDGIVEEWDPDNETMIRSIH